MDIRILFIDDEPGISKDLSEIFDEKKINSNNLVTDFAETFEDGLNRISNESFDLIVSDLCKGKPSKDAERDGLEVLKKIKEKEFIPVIFYSGIANIIQDLKSEIVEGEFVVGDIIEKDENIFLLLTPSCDYVERFDKSGTSKGRKADKVLIAKAIPLTDFQEYIEFKSES